MDWCLQPHALSTPIQGQPGKSCFTQEGAGATSAWSMGWCDTATLSVRLPVEQQDNNGGDKARTHGVSTAQPGAPGVGSTASSAGRALKPGVSL